MKSLPQQKSDLFFWVKENSFLAWLAAIKLRQKNMAITIGKTIHLHNCTAKDFLNNEDWLRHELVHIRQFQHYGFVRFVFLYLMESIRNGYHNNKFEAEARKEVSANERFEPGKF